MLQQAGNRIRQPAARNADTLRVMEGYRTMEPEQLEPCIQDRGRQFFADIGDEAPSVFKKDWWTGKVMDACMHNEPFKVQLFRFIDVLPYLTTAESLGRHIEQYFSRQQNVPAALKWGIKGVGRSVRRRPPRPAAGNG